MRVGTIQCVQLPLPTLSYSPFDCTPCSLLSYTCYCIFECILLHHNVTNHIWNESLVYCKLAAKSSNTPARSDATLPSSTCRPHPCPCQPRGCWHVCCKSQTQKTSCRCWRLQHALPLQLWGLHWQVLRKQLYPCALRIQWTLCIHGAGWSYQVARYVKLWWQSKPPSNGGAQQLVMDPWNPHGKSKPRSLLPHPE